MSCIQLVTIIFGLGIRAPIIAEAHGRHSETPKRVCWSPSQREEGVEALNRQTAEAIEHCEGHKGVVFH